MVKHYSKEEIEKRSAEYNRIFTVFQKLDNKVSHWKPLQDKTAEKWKLLLAQQQIDALTSQIRLSKKQIREMRAYTKWFIILTASIIFVEILDILSRIFS